jgi:hypothetical protein
MAETQALFPFSGCELENGRVPTDHHSHLSHPIPSHPIVSTFTTIIFLIPPGLAKTQTKSSIRDIPLEQPTPRQLLIAHRRTAYFLSHHATRGSS